ncbi:KIF-binding protein-like [Odontomachus brunneus]|uniref:KIF-binding protein-like n=1 Tax=Odontomachus brunneus TaxID=486640 RepID=UPI0013F2647F|nr:KIF-binding protein-like [Odontomachus brunneus]XP_032680835.1 KIF-binding protein-like [Odontomachus brunneus]
MLTESTNEQEYKSTGPASVMQTEMVESKEDTESTRMHVREEFVEILMSSNVARDSTKGIEPTKKQARMIRLIEGRMNKLFTDKLNSEDAKSDDTIALAQSYLHISQIYNDVIWKDTSEAYLLRALGLLEGRETTRKAILTAMKVHNCLGAIYTDLKNPKRSLSFYEKAFLLYWTYTNKKDSYPAPIDILYVFGVVTKEFQSGYSLDSQYMLTLTKLIQLHTHMDEHQSITIIYQHMLLQKQVRLIPLTIGRTEWALKAATISEYLSMHNRFTEARSHLGIAFYMLNKFYRDEYGKIDGTKFPEIKTSLYNQYRNAAAYTNIYAAQYGIALLRSSKDRQFEEENKQRETKSESLTTFEQKLPDFLVFTSTSNVEEEFNIWITDKYLANYNDAKAVFSNVLRCLNEVWSYKINMIYPEIQIDILLKMSQACRYLACYEQNGNKQVMLHLWRLDILKNATKLFNKDNKKHEKLILLELAVTHVTVLDIYLDELHFYQKSKPDSSPNMSHYVKNALVNFMSYLDLA